MRGKVGGSVCLKQGHPLQSSVKLRLLCSQVLKELLGQSVDVSPGPNTPLSDNLMSPIDVCSEASQPPWTSPSFPEHSLPKDLG